MVTEIYVKVPVTLEHTGRFAESDGAAKKAPDAKKWVFEYPPDPPDRSLVLVHLVIITAFY
jgi:hypothetical protein